MSDPFDLSAEQLARVEVALSYHSPKTGAGEQLVLIKGEGPKAGQAAVRLRRTANRDAPPVDRDSTLPHAALRALLDLMCEAGFLGLEESYVAPPPERGLRVIRLKLPDHEKSVSLEYPIDCAHFERCAGAIKLAAGLADPDALRHRFFANL